MKGPTYWHPMLYQAAMRLLYGRRFSDRYRSVAAAVPDESSVVDLCCGDAHLYRHYLCRKGVAYLGLDINGSFVRWLLRRGVSAREFDARCDTIPRADVILMLSALYQFIPHEDRLLARMVESAERYVILAEPVHNLSTSANPVLAWLGRRLSDPGTGGSAKRLDAERLQQLVEPYKIDLFQPIAGGRDMLVRIAR